MIRQSLTLLSLCLLVLGTSVRSETRVPQSSAEITLGFAPLVKEAAPAVVNIYAKIVTQSRGRSPFMDDPFFEDLFRGFNQPRPRVENSLGSGVILTADGVVVSNYHVVGMASEIRVVTNDRREFNARVVLADQALRSCNWMMQIIFRIWICAIAIRSRSENWYWPLAILLGLGKL